MSDWEVIRNEETMVRRIAVPGGWLYQIQSGRSYIGHPSWNEWAPVWFPPYFVPDDTPRTRRREAFCLSETADAVREMGRSKP